MKQCSIFVLLLAFLFTEKSAVEGQTVSPPLWLWKDESYSAVRGSALYYLHENQNFLPCQNQTNGILLQWREKENTPPCNGSLEVREVTSGKTLVSTDADCCSAYNVKGHFEFLVSSKQDSRHVSVTVGCSTHILSFLLLAQLGKEIISANSTYRAYTYSFPEKVTRVQLKTSKDGKDIIFALREMSIPPVYSKVNSVSSNSGAFPNFYNTNTNTKSASLQRTLMMPLFGNRSESTLNFLALSVQQLAVTYDGDYTSTGLNGILIYNHKEKNLMTIQSESDKVTDSSQIFASCRKVNVTDISFLSILSIENKDTYIMMCKDYMTVIQFQSTYFIKYEVQYPQGWLQLDHVALVEDSVGSFTNSSVILFQIKGQENTSMFSFMTAVLTNNFLFSKDTHGRKNEEKVLVPLWRVKVGTIEELNPSVDWSVYFLPGLEKMTNIPVIIFASQNFVYVINIYTGKMVANLETFYRYSDPFLVEILPIERNQKFQQNFPLFALSTRKLRIVEFYLICYHNSTFNFFVEEYKNCILSDVVMSSTFPEIFLNIQDNPFMVFSGVNAKSLFISLESRDAHEFLKFSTLSLLVPKKYFVIIETENWSEIFSSNISCDEIVKECDFLTILGEGFILDREKMFLLEFGWSKNVYNAVVQNTVSYAIDHGGGFLTAFDRQGTLLWETASPFGFFEGQPILFSDRYVLVGINSNSSVCVFDALNGDLLNIINFPSECVDQMGFVHTIKAEKPKLEGFGTDNIPAGNERGAFFTANIWCLLYIDETLRMRHVRLPFLTQGKPYFDEANSLVYVLGANSPYSTQIYAINPQIAWANTTEVFISSSAITKLYETMYPIHEVLVSSHYASVEEFDILRGSMGNKNSGINVTKQFSPMLYLAGSEGIVCLSIANVSKTFFPEYIPRNASSQNPFFIWGASMGGSVSALSWYNNSLFSVSKLGLCRLTIYPDVPEKWRAIWCTLSSFIKTTFFTDLLFTKQRGYLVVSSGHEIYLVLASTGRGINGGMNLEDVTLMDNLPEKILHMVVDDDHNVLFVYGETTLFVVDFEKDFGKVLYTIKFPYQTSSLRVFYSDSGLFLTGPSTPLLGFAIPTFISCRQRVDYYNASNYPYLMSSSIISVGPGFQPQMPIPPQVPLYSTVPITAAPFLLKEISSTDKVFGATGAAFASTSKYEEIVFTTPHWIENDEDELCVVVAYNTSKYIFSKRIQEGLSDFVWKWPVSEDIAPGCFCENAGVLEVQKRHIKNTRKFFYDIGNDEGSEMGSVVAILCTNVLIGLDGKNGSFLWITSFNEVHSVEILTGYTSDKYPLILLSGMNGSSEENTKPKTVFAVNVMTGNFFWRHQTHEYSDVMLYQFSDYDLAKKNDTLIFFGDGITAYTLPRGEFMYRLEGVSTRNHTSENAQRYDTICEAGKVKAGRLAHLDKRDLPFVFLDHTRGIFACSHYGTLDAEIALVWLNVTTGAVDMITSQRSPTPQERPAINAVHELILVEKVISLSSAIFNRDSDSSLEYSNANGEFSELYLNLGLRVVSFLLPQGIAKYSVLGVFNSPMSVYDNILYLLSDAIIPTSGSQCPMSHLWAYDSSNGFIKWKIPVHTTTSNYTRRDGILIFLWLNKEKTIIMIGFHGLYVVDVYSGKNVYSSHTSCVKGEGVMRIQGILAHEDINWVLMGGQDKNSFTQNVFSVTVTGHGIEGSPYLFTVLIPLYSGDTWVVPSTHTAVLYTQSLYAEENNVCVQEKDSFFVVYDDMIGVLARYDDNSIPNVPAWYVLEVDRTVVASKEVQILGIYLFSEVNFFTADYKKRVMNVDTIVVVITKQYISIRSAVSGMLIIRLHAAFQCPLSGGGQLSGAVFRSPSGNILLFSPSCVYKLHRNQKISSITLSAVQVTSSSSLVAGLRDHAEHEVVAHCRGNVTIIFIYTELAELIAFDEISMEVHWRTDIFMGTTIFALFTPSLQVSTLANDNAIMLVVVLSHGEYMLLSVEDGSLLWWGKWVKECIYCYRVTSSLVSSNTNMFILDASGAVIKVSLSFTPSTPRILWVNEECMVRQVVDEEFRKHYSLQQVEVSGIIIASMPGSVCAFNLSDGVFLWRLSDIDTFHSPSSLNFSNTLSTGCLQSPPIVINTTTLFPSMDARKVTPIIVLKCDRGVFVVDALLGYIMASLPTLFIPGYNMSSRTPFLNIERSYRKGPLILSYTSSDGLFLRLPLPLHLTHYAPPPMSPNSKMRFQNITEIYSKDIAYPSQKSMRLDKETKILTPVLTWSHKIDKDQILCKGQMFTAQLYTANLTCILLDGIVRRYNTISGERLNEQEMVNSLYLCSITWLGKVNDMLIMTYCSNKRNFVFLDPTHSPPRVVGETLREYDSPLEVSGKIALPPLVVWNETGLSIACVGTGSGNENSAAEVHCFHTDGAIAGKEVYFVVCPGNGTVVWMSYHSSTHVVLVACVQYYGEGENRGNLLAFEASDGAHLWDNMTDYDHSYSIPFVAKLNPLGAAIVKWFVGENRNRRCAIVFDLRSGVPAGPCFPFVDDIPVVDANRQPQRMYLSRDSGTSSPWLLLIVTNKVLWCVNVTTGTVVWNKSDSPSLSFYGVFLLGFLTNVEMETLLITRLLKFGGCPRIITAMELLSGEEHFSICLIVEEDMTGIVMPPPLYDDLYAIHSEGGFITGLLWGVATPFPPMYIDLIQRAVLWNLPLSSTCHEWGLVQEPIRVVRDEKSQHTSLWNVEFLTLLTRNGWFLQVTSNIAESSYETRAYPGDLMETYTMGLRFFLAVVNSYNKSVCLFERSNRSRMPDINLWCKILPIKEASGVKWLAPPLFFTTDYESRTDSTLGGTLLLLFTLTIPNGEEGHTKWIGLDLLNGTLLYTTTVHSCNGETSGSRASITHRKNKRGDALVLFTLETHCLYSLHPHKGTLLSWRPYVVLKNASGNERRQRFFGSLKTILPEENIDAAFIVLVDLFNSLLQVDINNLWDLSYPSNTSHVAPAVLLVELSWFNSVIGFTSFVTNMPSRTEIPEDSGIKIYNYKAMVYIATGGMIYCFDVQEKNDGHFLWKYFIGGDAVQLAFFKDTVVGVSSANVVGISLNNTLSNNSAWILWNLSAATLSQRFFLKAGQRMRRTRNKGLFPPFISLDGTTVFVISEYVVGVRYDTGKSIFIQPLTEYVDKDKGDGESFTTRLAFCGGWHAPAKLPMEEETLRLLRSTFAVQLRPLQGTKNALHNIWWLSIRSLSSGKELMSVPGLACRTSSTLQETKSEPHYGALYYYSYQNRLSLVSQLLLSAPLLRTLLTGESINMLTMKASIGKMKLSLQNVLPQRTSNEAPWEWQEPLPNGVAYPSLGCVINVQSISLHLFECVNKSISDIYAQAAKTTNQINCTKAAKMLIDPCIVLYLQQIISGCNAAIFYLDAFLTYLGKQPVLDFCIAPHRCVDGTTGSNEFCNVLLTAETTMKFLSNVTKKRPMRYPNDFHFPYPAEPFPAYQIPTADSEKEKFGSGYLIIAFGVSISLLATLSIALYLVLRYRSKNQHFTREGIELEMSLRSVPGKKSNAHNNYVPPLQEDCEDFEQAQDKEIILHDISKNK